MAETDEVDLPEWVPSGEPYRGTVDERAFCVDSEDGFWMRIYLERDRPLPRPCEIILKDGRLSSPVESRLEKTVRALAELGVCRIHLATYDPPEVAAEIPLNKNTPLSKAEAIAKLLLDLQFYAEKPA